VSLNLNPYPSPCLSSNPWLHTKVVPPYPLKIDYIH
jgi:hypothetical protein